MFATAKNHETALGRKPADVSGQERGFLHVWQPEHLLDDTPGSEAGSAVRRAAVAEEPAPEV